MGVEIVGPFQHRELHVGGWSVPFITCCEVDGGKVEFVVDRRLGFTVSAGDFEQVARLVANSIAVALGVSCFPGDFDEELSEEKQRDLLGHLHIALRPRRCHGITMVETEEAPDVDDSDPRNQERS